MKSNSFSKITYFILLIFFVNIITYAVNKDSSNMKEVTLALKWKHQFQFAGYYAADIMGFYKEKNIKINFKESVYGTKAIERVLEKEGDFGIASPYILLNIANKDPLKIVNTVFQHSPNCIITKKDSGIKTPHDLNGKTLMIDLDYDGAIYAMLVQEGVKNLIVVKQSYNYDDFISGKVDALSAYTTNEPFLFKKKGIEVNIINPLTYGIDFYGDILFTSKKLVKNDPQLVKDFKEASLKGWKYAFEHPDEIIKHIRKKYRPDLSYEKLYDEYEKTRELVMPDLVELGHINKDRLKHIFETFKFLDLISEKSQLPDDFIFESDENNFQLLSNEQLFFFYIVITLIIIIFLWNYQLRKKVIKATKEANQSKEKYKNLISNLPGIVFREKIGKEKNTIFLSHGIFEITGFNPEYFTGDSAAIFTDIIHPEDKEKVQNTLKKAVSEKSSYEIEYRITTKNGLLIWVFEKGNYIEDEEGEFLEGIILNTTEKNKLKETIIQSAKILSIGGIAAGIAHEINNPLSGIVQSGQNLKRRLSVDDPKNKKIANDLDLDMKKLERYMQSRNIYDFIDGIQDAGMRASKIIKNLLSFSRNSKTSMTKTDIINTINESLNIASNEFDLDKNIDFKKIKIIKEFPNEPIAANIIPTEIEQVILNILKNSCQVLFENNIPEKKILIRLFSDKDNKKIIEIANNGPKIDNEIRKSIFEPFFTTKKENSGTGLGLSISYFIIKEHHNGSIDVYSDDEYGAIFRISLP